MDWCSCNRLARLSGSHFYLRKSTQRNERRVAETYPRNNGKQWQYHAMGRDAEREELAFSPVDPVGRSARALLGVACGTQQVIGDSCPKGQGLRGVRTLITADCPC
jgi:hypothetical protein